MIPVSLAEGKRWVKKCNEKTTAPVEVSPKTNVMEKGAVVKVAHFLRQVWLNDLGNKWVIGSK